MADDEERLAKFVHFDEHDPRHPHEIIHFGFENELKSITVLYGDTARFQARLRLYSSSPIVQINRQLLQIEWRFNDTPIDFTQNLRYHFDSIENENLFWLDIRHCEQQDEGVYTLAISYDHQRFQDESSAYLFVDSETNFPLSLLSN